MILVRFLTDTGTRLLYPFLPVVAREVGMPLQDAGFLIAVMVATGLLAPLFGPLTDKWGPRRVSLSAQAGFALAALVAAAGGSRHTLLVALGVMGLCRAVLVPALQVELSDRFAYRIRGRALATTEIAWGLAALVGFPLVGGLIAATGTFRTAYLLIGLLGAILLPLPWAVLRQRPERRLEEHFQAEPFRPHAGFWASIAAAFLLLLSFNLLLVAYGAWAEASFGLDPAGLGLLSLTIGLGEVSGAVAAGLWIERCPFLGPAALQPRGRLGDPGSLPGEPRLRNCLQRLRAPGQRTDPLRPRARPYGGPGRLPGGQPGRVAGGPSLAGLCRIRQQRPSGRGGDAPRRRCRTMGDGGWSVRRPISRAAAQANQRRTLLADAALLGIALIWGATFVMVKEAVAQVGVFTFLSVRFALGAVLLAAAVRAGRLRTSRRLLAAGALIGLFLFGGYALQTLGLRWTTASKAGFITGLSVVLVPILSASLLRRLPSRPALAGVAMATLGLGLLTRLDAALLADPRLAFNQGDVLVLGGAVGFALHIVAVGRFAPDHPARPLAAAQVAAVALVSLPLAIGEGFTWPLPAYVWGAAAFTGILATGLAFLVQTAAQRHTSPTHTALLFATEPVFAALFGFLLAAETLAPVQVLGCVLILAGMLAAELPLGLRTRPGESSRGAG
ncbi:MAG: MFS transporter [Anaerolineae bacterium]